MNPTIELLQRFVSYPTVSSQTVLPLASELAQLAEDLGFTVHRFESTTGKMNVVAQIGPADAQALALCGHMDVVPVDGQDWHQDPFTLTQRDGRLYGRGSCDMKGFIAVCMASLSSLPLHNLKRGISLVWTHDEEVGCIGAQALIEQVTTANLTLPQAMLIGEPTSMHISRMHGGHTTVAIQLQGLPAHSSKPHLGKSAIAAASRLISEIQEIQQWLQLSPCKHHDMNHAHSLIHVAQIHGGEAINIIPEHCHMRLGIRPMPGDDIEEIIAKIKDRLLTVDKHYGTHSTLTIPQNAPPMLTPLHTPLEKALHALLPQAEMIGVPFATDGGWMADLGVLPLICGPGSIDLAHKANEYVEIADLYKCQQMVTSLIEKWCILNQR